MTEAISTKLREPNQISALTPWDLDFRQLSRGSAATDLSFRVGRTVTVLSIAMQSDVHQNGEAPPELITVGLPAQGSLSKWLGEEVPQNAMISFGSGHEFDGVSMAGFKAITLSIPKDAISRLAADFGLELSADAFRPGVFDLNDTERPTQLLERKSKAFLADGILQADFAAEEDICLALLLTTSNSEMRRLAGPRRLRDIALRRALESIDAHTDQVPTVRELCKKAGASWPTLHRAFVEHFGIGPKAYLSNLRLTRARSALLAADVDTRVTDIANSHDFWHMGQFASDYRKLFNRLPSEDLNSANSFIFGVS